MNGDGLMAAADANSKLSGTGTLKVPRLLINAHQRSRHEEEFSVPLFVHSEHDLREAAELSNSLLVQSDPALPNSLLLPTSSHESSRLPGTSGTLDKSDDGGIGAELDVDDMSKYGTPPASIAGATATNRRGPHRARNQSELEVNARHYQMQRQYKTSGSRSRRHLTGIDFEGILRIIGGCNTWQILIYVLISTHQMPHAMFNLSVVYFTYRPDHWCKIPIFNRDYVEAGEGVGEGWTWERALASGIAFPKVYDHHRRGRVWHDQCLAYTLPTEEYRRLLSLNYTAAMEELEAGRRRGLPPPSASRCTEWDYDLSVMRESVVSQWHRVCDENWSRAHVHLSYSLG